jgi:hypothetical protein
VRTRLSVVSDATIQRIGTAGDTSVHFFHDPDAHDQIGSQREFSAAGSASGVGDVIFRIKGTALRRSSVGLALGADVRAPTGDEKDLLGSGAVGLKPYAALSAVIGRIAPHVNLAYQWNGKSELAGDVKTGSVADLPNQILYVAGADVAVSRNMTLAFDFIGQRVTDSPRLFTRTFTSSDPMAKVSFSDIGITTASFDQWNGAVGLKTNIAGSMLVNFNLAFPLNNAGLRGKVIPLIGLEYGF